MGRGDQDENDGTLELSQEKDEAVSAPARPESIGAVAQQPILGLRAGQSLGGGSDLGKKVGRWCAPECQDFRPLPTRSSGLVTLSASA